MNVLTQRLRLAADYLSKKGWVQGVQIEGGRVCLTGAVRYCAPQTGDEYLIRGVLRHRGTAEAWNDEEERTVIEVLDVLRRAEITNADLEDVFGPQWREIVTLIRQAASATKNQVLQLDASWSASWDAARDASRDASWDAARDASRDASRDAAWDASRDAARSAAQDASWGAARDASWSASWDAAWDASHALVVRDLISHEHFDLLYGPWASVFGDPIPCEL